MLPLQRWHKETEVTMSTEARLVSLDCYHVPNGWPSPLQAQYLDFISWPMGGDQALVTDGGSLLSQ